MKKLLFLLYFIPIITFGQTIQNVTPFFGADIPYHNPADSIYVSWTNKPDGVSALYTAQYLRNNFLQWFDSTRYVTPYYLTHANMSFKGTPNFTNGLTIEGGTIIDTISNTTVFKNGGKANEPIYFINTKTNAAQSILFENSDATFDRLYYNPEWRNLTWYGNGILVENPIDNDAYVGTYNPFSGNTSYLEPNAWLFIDGTTSNTLAVHKPNSITTPINDTLQDKSGTIALTSDLQNYLDVLNNPVTNNSTPLYLQSTFQAASQRLYIQGSKDGINFFPLNNSTNSYLPPMGTDNVRDPSIMKYNGYYYVIHTSGVVGQCTYFLIERSTDMINWSYYSTLSTSAISPYASWAPEWFVDPVSSRVYIYFALVSTSSGASPVTLYYCTANAALNSFSTPTAVNITSAPSRLLDPFMVYSDGTYYLFYTEEDLVYNGYISCATSTSPTGTFTITQSGNAFGFGGGFEGPCITQEGSTYYLYIDNYGNNQGNYYSTSSNLTTWTTPVKINNPYPSRHGTVIAVTSQTDINNILSSAAMNAATNIGTYNLFNTGLTNAGGIITNNVLTGVAGGQTWLGGTNASDNLYLTANSNSSPTGNIYFGKTGANSPTAYSEANRTFSVYGNSATTPMAATMWAKDGNPGLYIQRWTGSGTNYANWRFYNGAGSSGQNFGIDYGATTSLSATPTWSNMFFINTSGQIGLGTTTPSSWLDLRAGTTSGASLIIPSGVAPTAKVTGQIWNLSGSRLQFYDGSTTQSIAELSDIGTTVRGYGQVTLSSGQATVSISGVSTSSRAHISFVSIGGTVSTTWQYAGVCTSGTLTITALTNTGGTNTSDTSVLTYYVEN